MSEPRQASVDLFEAMQKRVEAMRSVIGKDPFKLPISCREAAILSGLNEATIPPATAKKLRDLSKTKALRAVEEVELIEGVKFKVVAVEAGDD